jgi:diguanylate cyclase (GGDEF)-like protein
VKILLADDDPVSRATLETMLVEQGYDVIAAEDGTRAWNILASPDAPPLALLDWVMPGVEGIELCRRVRRRRNAPYVYIVLLTGRHGKEDLVTGMKSGADDYLVKPADPEELGARLRAGRRVIELQQALLEDRARLREQATRDPLTSLWNRAWMLENLRRELARANRRNESLSIALVDVDRFKAVNDGYGHLAGDAVLCECARRIESSVREYDKVGRYGGDELLIILPECGPEAARDMADRIRHRVAAEPVPSAVAAVSATVSIGVATKPVDRTADAGTLIATADSALYRAKRDGRDTVVAATIGETTIQAAGLS